MSHKIPRRRKVRPQSKRTEGRRRRAADRHPAPVIAVTDPAAPVAPVPAIQ